MERNELKHILKEYMAVPRLSGYEKEMAYRFRADMERYTQDVRIDRVGNVIATFPGTEPSAPGIMIFAHMDTIGFVITCITENGFLKLDRVGGVPEKALQGLQVLVGNEAGDYYNGVIGMRSYHTLDPKEKEKADTLSSLFADIGAKSREEVLQLGIQVGCPVIYANHYSELLNDRIAGTYTDDASGLTSMIHIASMLKAGRTKATVYLVGTVQEEFNARGAMLAQRSVHADMAICLLGAGAGDTPDLAGSNNVRLGEGVSITLFNFHGKGTLNGNIAHRGMFSLMKEAAKAAGIPLQRQASRGALSDTAYLQLEDMGVPCLDMGTPDRYSHSPLEVLDLKDLERTGVLVYTFIDLLSADFNCSRY
jgi:putative aminopeptidase FrvX